jgi:hypothetical protein
VNSEESPRPDVNPTPDPGASSVAPPVQAPPAAQPTTEQQLANAEERMSQFERATLRLGRYGLAVTVLTGIFIVLQWREMHTGSVDTHTLAEAAKSQAEAANKGADAAMRAATAAETASKVASDSLEIGERAYVLIETEDNPSMLQFGPGKQLFINIKYLNTGRSPAKNVTVATQNPILSTDKPERHILKATPERIKAAAADNIAGISKATLAPGKHGFVTAVGPMLSADDFGKIQGGKLYIGVHGQIFYDDIFGKHHLTEYCLVYLTGGAFAFCNQYNTVN